ncbi:hypothetical protein VU677_07350 [Hafnia paralvei]|uniref:hypothetical protein n=1 Tax=Hafnia paralvei TaxID=546367 RepID=UPI00300CA5FD
MMAPFSKLGRINIVITYNDIKAKREATKEAQKAYVQKLRDVAKKLIDTYTQSLELPNESWRNLNGDKHPYVYIQSGGFDCLPENVGVDPYKGASFDLYTVTDDNPREPQTEKVTVSINVIDGEKIEVVVTGSRIEAFTPVDSDEKINEVCEFIKDNIIMSMNDVSFGISTPKESVRLWD